MVEKSALPVASLGPVWDEASPSRQRWAKVLGGVFLGLLGIVVASCAIAAYLYRPRSYDDPQAARAVASDILKFTPCVGYEPRGTILWDVFSMMSLRGVYYEHRTEDGLLMLVEVGTSRLQGYSQVQAHIEQMLREKNGIADALVVSPVAEKLTMTIQGRTREFALSRARDAMTDRDYRLLEGLVDGTTGPVLIGMRVAENAWNIDAVRGMLESIH